MWRRRDPALAGLKGLLFPKQLLPLMGEQSLLQQTAKRLPAKLFGPALIVSGEDQRFFIKRQLEAVGAPVEAILLEPVARNTSAAAGLAAAWRSRGRDELMLVMPSDHVIADGDAFMAAVRTGSRMRRVRCHLRRKPTEPNTQFGYIEADAGARSLTAPHRSRGSSRNPSPDRRRIC